MAQHIIKTKQLQYKMTKDVSFRKQSSDYDKLPSELSDAQQYNRSYGSKTSLVKDPSSY